MKNKIRIYSILIVLFAAQFVSAQTFCTDESSEQITGTQDGYRYELWNQNGQGTGCITINDGALFSGEWSGILNYLARRGLGYDQTKEHYEYGRFFTDYNCDYNPSSASGNSYLSVYGWTVEPLIEFYIVEDWRNWIPSMANDSEFKGTITANGSVYDIYENTRYDAPSILGTATFQQYFSIRRSERNSGTINISDHFDEWENLGMFMGKMHEVSFVVEGYQSSGNFNFTELDVYTQQGNNYETKVENSKLFKAYPNPSNGTLFIELNEPEKQSTISIYDAVNRLVYSHHSQDENLIQIDALKPGIYFVALNGSMASECQKIVIN